MSENRAIWIPVSVSEGMFSSEYAITLKTIEGTLVSLYADKSLVQKKGESSFLKVTHINSYPDQHKQRVLLPSETFETSSRWVDLKEEKLESV